MINNLKFLEEHASGDLEYMRDLILIYITKMPEYLKELNANFSTQNWSGISNQAHKMKSPATLFGDSQLKELLEDLELKYPEHLSENKQLRAKIDAINDLLPKSIAELRLVLDKYQQAM